MNTRVKVASADGAKQLVSKMKDKSVLPKNESCVGSFDVKGDEEPYLVQSVSTPKNEPESEKANETPEVVEGRLISYWEDGNTIATGCKANLATREILEIESCDDGADHGICVDESVIIKDKKSPVRNLDSIVEQKVPGELYQILLNMKKNTTFWHSRSGLNFYEELVKARIAAYPLHFCDEYCDEVTISIKENDSQFFEYRTDEDEVYSLHHPDATWGEKISGVLADAVRLFAKKQMQLYPGRWVTPEDCDDWFNAIRRASQWSR